MTMQFLFTKCHVDVADKDSRALDSDIQSSAEHTRSNAKTLSDWIHKGNQSVTKISRESKQQQQQAYINTLM